MTTAGPSLDIRYGPSVPPQSPVPDRPSFQPWESAHFPNSLSRLDAATAPILAQLMCDIRSGWAVGTVLTNDVTIIWVVDLAGKIWFAIEELFLNGSPIGIPKHRTMSLTARASKLGHPALVACANARIGGEIFFDPTREPPAWVINNRSGRYGSHPSRTRAHLSNVATDFLNFGIQLSAEFI